MRVFVAFLDAVRQRKLPVVGSEAGWAAAGEHATNRPGGRMRTIPAAQSRSAAVPPAGRS